MRVKLVIYSFCGCIFVPRVSFFDNYVRFHPTFLSTKLRAAPMAAHCLANLVGVAALVVEAF